MCKFLDVIGILLSCIFCTESLWISRGFILTACNFCIKTYCINSISYKKICFKYSFIYVNLCNFKLHTFCYNFLLIKCKVRESYVSTPIAEFSVSICSTPKFICSSADGILRLLITGNGISYESNLYKKQNDVNIILV